jgi:hypothetical protein
MDGFSVSSHLQLNICLQSNPVCQSKTDFDSGQQVLRELVKC